MVKKACLIVFLLISFTGVAFGNNSITPFGSLSWEDGLFDTVTKLNQMKGIERIDLLLEGNERIASLKGVTKNKLNEVITAVLTKKYGFVLKRKNDPRAKMAFEYYKDKNGLDQRFPTRSLITIEAYPIMITDRLFTMTLGFTQVKGLSIHRPNKVMIEEKWKIAFPLILTSVKLKSKSPTNYKKLDAILEKKYRPYDKRSDSMHINEHDRLQGCVWDGINGSQSPASQFCVESDIEKYSIVYRSDVYKAVLLKIYLQHLGDLEKKKTINKKDMSSDL